MNYKIVVTESEYPDVLLYRDRDDQGNEIVTIQAVGTSGEDQENDDYFAIETVEFSDYKTAQSFIRDFSGQSAEEWCVSQNILL
jgi:hypothetical protein